MSEISTGCDNSQSRLLSNQSYQTPSGFASANRDPGGDYGSRCGGVYSSDVENADARVPLRHAGIWVRACLVCS